MEYPRYRFKCGGSGRECLAQIAGWQFLLSAAFGLLISSCGERRPNATEPPGPYVYRWIAGAYDSTTIQSVWGELTLDGPEQQRLAFRPYIGLPGLDTTLDAANRVCRTETFPIHVSGESGRVLHLFRTILAGGDDSSAANHFTRDTLEWIAELVDAARGNRIATVDSIGAFPLAKGSAFPSIFGTDTSRSRIDFRIDNKFRGVDSCFLRIRMSKRGPGSPRWQIWDLESRIPVLTPGH